MVTDLELAEFKAAASVNLETALYRDRGIVMRLISDLEEARRLLKAIQEQAYDAESEIFMVSCIDSDDLREAARYLQSRGVK